jgi:signal transduction histidine kinase
VLRSRADVALSRAREPEAYVDALTAVGLEAERMGRIVDDLLTLARVDAGERAIVRQPLYLDDLALDAVSGVRVLAETHGVDLDVKEFEEAPVEADPTLVRQLLVILLDNAVKFTPTGGSVSLSVRSADGCAIVTVEDTGVGISPAELPRIYDRFYRGDDARRRSDGAGLGLSIAKWIADTHGADIELVSTVGQGTCVTVRFPPTTQIPATVGV